VNTRQRLWEIPFVRTLAIIAPFLVGLTVLSLLMWLSGSADKAQAAPKPSPTPSPTAPAPTPYTLGRVVATATGVVQPNFVSQAVIKAQCPAGKVVVGGGHAYSGTSPIDITTSAPDELNEAWEVDAQSTPQSSTQVTVTAYAICVYAA
jgi:hypothetical protein